MKNLNKFLITLFLLTALSSQAQNNARKGWDGVVKGGSKVNLSYSSAMPSTSTKDAYILSSSGISADTFIPFSLFRKGWDGTVKGGNFGINIGGTYSFGGNGNPSATLPNGFAIFGQTTSSVSYKGADPEIQVLELVVVHKPILV
ncbi:hypothetical protein FNJ88_00945 [Chryseobacterium sp. SNU WT5]|uniref:hypothetical protein n=1 Tax=Chryseobacterium sp. SNU WT5 TaxID=2594269 RepID=UPI00118052C6|nr:hypothetical protein [Chryseobacterium sp. SNU WT5]QDP84191.1 hypothetical protein FNJ88_00945 [Chryseobacterium sp. SNU WT5]